MMNIWYTWDVKGGQWQHGNSFDSELKPSRYYGYSIAPNYLSLTTWTFNAKGERLRSDRFTPSAGLSHRERYNAICEMIKNVGLTPPPYQA